jgi:hypothetical protein
MVMVDDEEEDEEEDGSAEGQVSRDPVRVPGSPGCDRNK